MKIFEDVDYIVGYKPEKIEISSTHLLNKLSRNCKIVIMIITTIILIVGIICFFSRIQSGQGNTTFEIIIIILSLVVDCLINRGWKIKLKDNILNVESGIFEHKFDVANLINIKIIPQHSMSDDTSKLLNLQIQYFEKTRVKNIEINIESINNSIGYDKKYIKDEDLDRFVNCFITKKGKIINPASFYRYGKPSDEEFNKITENNNDINNSEYVDIRTKEENDEFEKILNNNVLYRNISRDLVLKIGIIILCISVFGIIIAFIKNAFFK